MIEDYSRALRPMITLYAVFDQLSKEFIASNSDEITGEASMHLATKLELCYKSNGIHELLRVAEINVGDDVICKCLRRVPQVVEKERCSNLRRDYEMMLTLSLSYIIRKEIDVIPIRDMCKDLYVSC